MRHIVLEVISDDCDGLYEDQPKCSATRAILGALGYAPLTPLFCTPSNAPRTKHWRQTAWGCELDVVFSRHSAPPLAQEAVLLYHKPGMNGCHNTTTGLDSAPVGALVMTSPEKFSRRRAEAEGGEADTGHTTVHQKFAGAEPYLCLRSY